LQKIRESLLSQQLEAAAWERTLRHALLPDSENAYWS